MATEFDNNALDALARGPEITNVVMRETARVAQIARADAPVDSADYKNGIRATLKHQKRSVGVVEATDEKSLIIEAKQGILARATKKAARKR